MQRSPARRDPRAHTQNMSLDPAVTNPQYYKVILENEKVRVLEYVDQPGDRTTPHAHPDSVMYTLSSFHRRLVLGEEQREVQLDSGVVTWLPAQQHQGENIGETPTHVIFVELKESGTNSEEQSKPRIGPQENQP